FLKIVFENNLFFKKNICQLRKFILVFFQKIYGTLVLTFYKRRNFFVNKFSCLFAVWFGEIVFRLSTTIVIGKISNFIIQTINGNHCAGLLRNFFKIAQSSG